MLEFIQNRKSTRKESGQYGHDMGLRDAMSEPQSVWEGARQEQVDFRIESVPMGVETEEQGFFVPTKKGNPMRMLHYRTDTMTALVDHPGTYTLRRDGYGPIFDEMEKMFGETCTMVRSLDNGLRLYMLFQPEEPVDFGGGQMIPTVGLSASLDSSIATSMHAFAFDPFCTNAFTSRSAVMRTKATANHDVFFASRMEILAQTVNQTKALARIARIANDQEFTELEFTRMVSELPKVASLREAAATKFDVAQGMHVPAHKTRVKNYEFHIDSIWEEWRKDRARFGDTKWAAFSSIQGAEQHHLNGGLNGSKAKKAERVLRKGLFDPHHELTNQAWKALRFDELVGA
jgi:hypothetical protein